MIYTSGVISDINKEETLEELQDNKLAIVCEKIQLKKDDRLLDIGCGWGTLAKYASVNYGAQVTGITLGRNQTAWGNNGLRKAGIPEEQSKILCMDYRDIPVPEGRYSKITCLEMAEHVGVRHFKTFLKQVYDMLDDDGIFFLQIAGLRKSWQYEDLLWGLFMNKYIFPGADASTPLGFFIDNLEGAGFEVKHTDTIGVHYSATLWRWYRNWMANRSKVEAKYGSRWFRVSPLDEKMNCANNMIRSGSSSSHPPPLLLDKVVQLVTKSRWSRILTLPTVLRESPHNSILMGPLQQEEHTLLPRRLLQQFQNKRIWFLSDQMSKTRLN
jgi:cyclopropane fatty-acyl-phospholipid synthase-like methyltransferase